MCINHHECKDYNIPLLIYLHLRDRQRFLLISDEPHDCPIFRKHLGPDQDSEHGENLEEEILTETKTQNQRQFSY